VEEFTATGSFIRAWGRQNLNATGLKPDDFYGPRGIAIGPGGSVYVADTGHKRIQVFDANGRFLRSIGETGGGPGQFNEPSSVALDAAGNLFVADFWNARVQEFSARGTYVMSFPVTSWQGGYDEPQIAVDAADHVLVPDPTGARMLVYSSAGKPMYAWDGAPFVKPVSVAVNSAGLAYVVDSGSNSVSAYSAP
jgi:DNA-binding beta-propeller fold protein YncE